MKDTSIILLAILAFTQGPDSARADHWGDLKGGLTHQLKKARDVVGRTHGKTVVTTKPKKCKDVPRRFRHAEYPYAAKPNGCGDYQTADEVRDTWGPVSFVPACDAHDRCYSTLGKSFRRCNDEFRRNLTKACDRDLRIPIPFTDKTLPPEPTTLATCYTVVGSYFVGVSSGRAKKAYEKAQDLQQDYEEWCATCEEEK
jgi:hypothetical protein